MLVITVIVDRYGHFYKQHRYEQSQTLLYRLPPSFIILLWIHSDYQFDINGISVYRYHISIDSITLY